VRMPAIAASRANRPQHRHELLDGVPDDCSMGVGVSAVWQTETGLRMLSTAVLPSQS
jgi:hypothetical protein